MRADAVATEKKLNFCSGGIETIGTMYFIFVDGFYKIGAKS
jgi:hypothetical protein